MAFLYVQGATYSPKHKDEKIFEKQLKPVILVVIG